MARTLSDATEIIITPVNKGRYAARNTTENSDDDSQYYDLDLSEEYDVIDSVDLSNESMASIVRDIIDETLHAGTIDSESITCAACTPPLGMTAHKERSTWSVKRNSRRESNRKKLSKKSTAVASNAVQHLFYNGSVENYKMATRKSSSAGGLATTHVLNKVQSTLYVTAKSYLNRLIRRKKKQPTMDDIDSFFNGTTTVALKG
ncbi:hypothetical protein SARC_07318 [Sphaeroforma arctica JP610]|uniref:Uncharacterized protein n=1 Tax=Sphaeroforma arctica JP610 TaxID=667725 RepID=A0A0L0FU24_9EUKA|nr:hypothetical protein SARC_07318 [Sphaeroforma arctica JP610]KNC80327.1 hypothetical protein SARC_07318 [Sphaeroforma arctica JP610]|eukprot:XP_014154229.1 hypothetical protein SARC_07318 [Sphaeroforma arctica JP610]